MGVFDAVQTIWEILSIRDVRRIEIRENTYHPYHRRKRPLGPQRRYI